MDRGAADGWYDQVPSWCSRSNSVEEAGALA